MPLAGGDETREGWVPLLGYLPLSAVTLSSSATISELLDPTSRKRSTVGLLGGFPNFLRCRAFSSNKTFPPSHINRRDTELKGVGDAGKERLNLSFLQLYRIGLGIFADPIPPNIKPGKSGERQSQ